MTDMPGERESAPAVINESDLADISTEVWGTPVHGETAANFLEAERRWVRRITGGTRVSLSTSEVLVWSELTETISADLRTGQLAKGVIGSYPIGIQQSSADEDYETDQIGLFVGRLWPVTPYPFEVPVLTGYTPPARHRSDPPSRRPGTGRLWQMEPGPVTPGRLENYLVTSGIARHALHGSVARAHDVLNIAAGVKRREEVAAQPPDSQELFIGYKYFRGKLADAKITDNARGKIREAIQDGMMEHIRYGRVPIWAKGNEIITDGRIELHAKGRYGIPLPERIALSSIAGIKDVYAISIHAESLRYLEDFVAGESA